MFAKRRKRVLDAMEPDAVAILIGASLVTRSADTEYPFRQDSDFWYLTGFAHPDAITVLRSSGGPPFTLFVQPREPEAEIWHGYRPGLEGAKQDYGADESFDCADLIRELPAILQGARRLYHVLGRRADIDAKIVEVLEDLRRRSRMGLSPAAEIVDPRDIIHEMRLYKEEAEIEILRRAADISREAHSDAARLAFDGHLEYELEAALQYSFRRRGGNGPAYAPIVGGGANAATLHYITNDQPLRDGDLVLIDAGVELEGYASDVTRTYPVGGRFQGARRAVYEVVLAAQEAALGQCRLGATLEEIHDLTVRSLVEGMLDLKLISGSVDGLIESGAYRPYYMHRTSHWLGLDVHDAGSYARGDKPRKLEPGMVFTVEPGIYVAANSEGEGSRDYRGIGVRIEDDVVMTATGHENLNAAIPKRVDEVEAWVNGD